MLTLAVIIFIYVGDNTKKDFLAPNELGWDSICIKDAGENIHPQNFNISEEYLPKFKVEDILEVINLVYENKKIYLSPPYMHNIERELLIESFDSN